MKASTSARAMGWSLLLGSAILTVGCVSASSTTVRSASPAPEAASATPDGDPWDFMAQLLPEHDLFQTLAGTWDITAKVWFSPDEPPREGHGTVRRTVVLGGRFLREELDAEIPTGTLHGVGFIGYNNLDGQYEYVWMDDRSSRISFETGRYNPETQTLVAAGSLRDPDTGALLHITTEIDVSNPDHHRSVGHTTGPDGVPFKTFEGTLTRR